ncbi:MAG: thioredoxin family protein [Sphaerochaetaceae bacterium]|nr:thioredoxin family protein [Sphaerochaetaceae bacterium]NLO61710.1 thioredoxin family protein [Spirochaetales bacterium]MDD2406815.1 thioredoxin family protein [Sphaerochaetaceae bacterium]MDD3670684.1 thioredoxin family protein [Sphaerochaetaceae bacterium]MDD4259416.1 thioredoxin family protein [Sphaerochaetaceae bacterium]
MIIKILGKGCPKCKALEEQATLAIAEIGIDASIEKVTDIDQIMDMGVMITPALVIDGEIKSVGKLLSKDRIIALLKT